MKFRSTLAAVVFVATLGSHSTAMANDFWIGAKVGTLGLGIEAAWRPIPWMDVRVGANDYNYNENGSQAGINYNATLNLSTFYATANILFPLSPFRISVGGFSNGNEVRMTSVDNPTYNIGGTSYSASEVGTLRSTTSFSSMSPYLGAGFDFSLFGKAGLNLDFGVLWQGDPDVSLTADGPIASDSSFQSQLEMERSELKDDFDALKAYPVVSLGFSYAFR
jgi:hypothetical protein